MKKEEETFFALPGSDTFKFLPWKDAPRKKARQLSSIGLAKTFSLFPFPRSLSERKNVLAGRPIATLPTGERRISFFFLSGAGEEGPKNGEEEKKRCARRQRIVN